MKPRKPAKTAPVKTTLVHKVPIKAQFEFEGDRFMKFAPKKGVSESGRIVTIADNVAVVVINS